MVRAGGGDYCSVLSAKNDKAAISSQITCDCLASGHSVVDGILHGLINYKDIKTKGSHLKILTCKETSRQVFARV